MIRICCDSIANLLANKGEKGFSVIAQKEELRRRFLLQYRPFTSDEMGRLSDTALNSPVTMNLSGTMTLLHCPYCGADLLELIAANPHGFDEMARDDLSLLSH